MLYATASDALRSVDSGMKYMESLNELHVHEPSCLESIAF